MLEGIRMVLDAGMHVAPENGENPFVLRVEDCGLLDQLEDL